MTARIAIMDKDVPSPLPLRKIYLLGLILASNYISLWMIFSTVPFMVAFYFPALGSSELGYKTGMLGSAFTCGGILGSCIWSTISDKFGRRPVLLFGLIGTAFSSILFGLSPSYQFAVIARFIWGFLNSHVAIASTYLNEICDGDERNQARGMAVLDVMGAVSRAVGAAIGGFLSFPAQYFRSMLEFTIFDRKPFALPCLVISAACFVVWMLAFFYLEETLQSTTVINAGKRHSIMNWNADELKEAMYGSVRKIYRDRHEGIAQESRRSSSEISSPNALSVYSNMGMIALRDAAAQINAWMRRCARSLLLPLLSGAGYRPVNTSSDDDDERTGSSSALREQPPSRRTSAYYGLSNKTNNAMESPSTVGFEEVKTDHSGQCADSNSSPSNIGLLQDGRTNGSNHLSSVPHGSRGLQPLRSALRKSNTVESSVEGTSSVSFKADRHEYRQQQSSEDPSDPQLGTTAYRTGGYLNLRQQAKINTVRNQALLLATTNDIESPKQWNNKRGSNASYDNVSPNSRSRGELSISPKANHHSISFSNVVTVKVMGIPHLGFRSLKSLAEDDSPLVIQKYSDSNSLGELNFSFRQKKEEALSPKTQVDVGTPPSSPRHLQYPTSPIVVNSLQQHPPPAPLKQDRSQFKQTPLFRSHAIQQEADSATGSQIESHHINLPISVSVGYISTASYSAPIDHYHPLRADHSQFLTNNAANNAHNQSLLRHRAEHMETESTHNRTEHISTNTKEKSFSDDSASAITTTQPAANSADDQQQNHMVSSDIQIDTSHPIEAKNGSNLDGGSLRTIDPPLIGYPFRSPNLLIKDRVSSPGLDNKTNDKNNVIHMSLEGVEQLPTLRYTNGSEFNENLIRNASTFRAHLCYLCSKRSVVLSCMLFGLSSFCSVLAYEVFPLMLVTSPHHGGLNFDIQSLGSLTMVVGLVTVFLQLSIYPVLAGRIGVVRLYGLSNWFMGAGCLLIPLMSYVRAVSANRSVQWCWAVLTHLWFSTSCSWIIISLFVVINNSCYSHERATVKRIGQACASIGRLLGPLVGANTFAWSQNNGYEWPFNYFFIWYVIAGLATTNYILSKMLPKSVERKRREPRINSYCAYSSLPQQDEELGEVRLQAEDRLVSTTKCDNSKLSSYDIAANEQSKDDNTTVLTSSKNNRDLSNDNTTYSSLQMHTLKHNMIDEKSQNSELLKPSSLPNIINSISSVGSSNNSENIIQKHEQHVPAEISNSEKKRKIMAKTAAAMFGQYKV